MFITNNFNKKAQSGILAFIFSYIITFLVWVYWAHEPIGEWGKQGIVNGGLTGVKAFLMSNLNLWVGIGFILGLIFILYGARN